MTQKKKAPTPSTQVPDAGAYYLRDKNTVSEYFVVANCSMTLATAITGVSFHSINDTILHSFNDSGMIRKSVLWTRLAVRTIPIIEDNHAWRRSLRTVNPLVVFLEPLIYTVGCVSAADIDDLATCRTVLSSGKCFAAIGTFQFWLSRFQVKTFLQFLIPVRCLKKKFQAQCCRP